MRLLAHGEKILPHGDFKGATLIKLHLKFIHYRNLLTTTKRAVTVSTVLLRPLTSLLEVHISETYQTYAC